NLQGKKPSVCIFSSLFKLVANAAASCRILRCNSDFVAATLDLGAMNAGYCSALRSYATCTRRMARACRGDLAYHSAVQGIEALLIQHPALCPQISVIFKNVPQCVEQKLYQAELDNVPAAFADGSVSSGDRLGHHSLKVQTQNPGRHAEIHAAHIGTLLVVRQSGRSLGLSVLLPRGVAEAYGPEQDLQLCVWGCPASQRLDTLRPPLPHASLPRTISAHAHCAALLPNRDVYYQACVFDLISSGDLNSSTAAIDALTDAGHMIPERERVHLLPLSAAAGKVYLNLILMMIIFILYNLFVDNNFLLMFLTC
uniref:Hemojuvelin BMP co-receptor n=1 Tax=Cynoglossus semilaevis TaxID=244447 RepID=A0A3P8UN36_CYNSE